ncbi:uncharacterized protein [Leptinotarsa decemlineata]|uniref:uncharacterized protein n=1 Tax=Leptinotarsa decemlineata TaxID=7539 RepID=UPI003D30B5D2
MMARKMVINRLDKEELEYELKIRGVGTGTCEEMRHRLGIALKMEKTGESLSYPAYSYSFEEDESAVKEKLDEIGSLLDTLSGPRTSGEAVKLHTKLAHVLGRIDRMDPDEDSGKTHQKANLVATALTLLSDFNDKLDALDTNPPVFTSVPAALNQLQTRLGMLSFNANINAAARSSTSADPDTTPNTVSKMIPPHKWNLQKFTGDGKGSSISAFFEVVDELRSARNVPEAVLFDSGMDLFAGRAYQFYKDCRSRVNSWEEMVGEFKAEYLSANHNDALFDELQKRTQHSSESIGVYLAVMASYFKRLGCPITEEAKLNIIIRNLHPFYQDRLREPLPKDLSELRTTCRKMESRRYMINSYVEPSSRKSNILEKDLAFVESESKVSEVDKIDATSSQMPSLRDQSRQIVCYRCRTPGHRAVGCTSRRKLQCFGCGKEGFTKNSCPSCSKTGNARGHP